jgi:hypothetical protein
MIGFSFADEVILENAQLGNDIKILINGEEYIPEDSSNTLYAPIMYNGNLYFHENLVELISKLNINYDYDNKEVSIGNAKNPQYVTAKDLNAKNLYYTENPKELSIKKQTFKSVWKVDPYFSGYDNIYFDTEKLQGKINTIKGNLYFEKSGKISEVKVLFRKSKSEYSEVLEYVTVKSGEITPFEIDTRGAEIIVMFISQYDVKYDKLKNLSIFDLQYK